MDEPTHRSRGEASTVSDLARLLSTDEAAFDRQFAAPALLFASGWWERARASAGSDDQTRRGAELAEFLAQTSVVDPKSGQVLPNDLQRTKLDDEGAAPRTREIDANGPLILAGSQVVPLRKTSRNPFSHMLTLGRASNNDVVLPDQAVSKFHAYILSRSGQWTITDQGSTNGTFIDEQRLAPGRPVSLDDGMVVRFGPEARTVFYSPAGLRGFVELFRRGIAPG